MTKYEYGWRTMSNGERIPLTKEEAGEMSSKIDKMIAERAKKLPLTVDCLSAICEAVERLRELGWSTMTPKENHPKACVQYTSTGMWEAVRQGEYIHFDGCVSGPLARNMMYKSLDDLTEDEKDRMKRCSENRPRYL